MALKDFYEDKKFVQSRIVVIRVVTIVVFLFLLILFVEFVVFVQLQFVLGRQHQSHRLSRQRPSVAQLDLLGRDRGDTRNLP